MSDKAKPEKGEAFDAWITKYALSQGVFVERVEQCKTDGMVHKVGAAFQTFYHGKDWHRTEAGAAARVRVMVAAKRKALAKQAARLDALDKDPLSKACCNWHRSGGLASIPCRATTSDDGGWNDGAAAQLAAMGRKGKASK